MMTVYRPVLSSISACIVMLSVAAMAVDPSVDPCTLVKNAEVEQIIDKPTGNPTSERNDRVRMCT